MQQATMAAVIVNLSLIAVQSSMTSFPAEGARAQWLWKLAARPWAFWLVLLICTLWFVVANHTWPLLNPDEGRYVGVALEMLHAREWGTPLLNGMPYFHKPPLFYWLTAISMSIFGENEFAARLVPAFAAVLMTSGIFLFLSRFTRQSLALCSAIILITTPLMFGAAHYANLDLLVAAMISSTILCGATATLLHQQGNNSWRWVMAMYLFAALGFLSKGLIGVVLPGAVLLMWLLVEKYYSMIPGLLRPTGILLFLLVILPWLLLMQSRFPGFFHYYFVYQQFDRFSQGGFNNVMPVWFYAAVLLVIMFAWYRKGMSVIFSRRYWQGEGEVCIRRLMWIWMIVILGFFSIPQSKLVGYILPVLPPLAFIFAEFFAGPRVREAMPEQDMTVPERGKTSSEWAKDAQCRSVAVNTRFSGRNFLVRLSVCVLLSAVSLIYMPFANLPGSSRIADAIRQIPVADRTGDQYFSLDYYPFDLGFYLGRVSGLAVVSGWDDPGMGSQDNWQKELWDARAFLGEQAQQRFVLPGAFRASMCRPQSQRRWILSDVKRTHDFPELETIQPYAIDGRYRVYRLDAGAVMSFCRNGIATR